ncbi:MAG: response regulator transcription factor [Nitratireductor sp.]|nr:response regulator transcription factor [Nitratireductor sp.]MCB1456582.1 response regulator transcription factor [Nitratireductor sp.]
MVVDDHDLVRDGIRARLASAPGIELCGECSSADEAIALAATARPDVILLDISMPGMNGLEAAPVLSTASPLSRILFLSIYDNEQYVQEALRVGGAGYLLKDVSRNEMLSAIMAVASGGTYIGSKLVNALTNRVGGTENRFGLTLREVEILGGIARGKTNKEIAADLEISVRTVESHRLSIREKTGGGNAAQLSRIADELGLLQ